MKIDLGQTAQLLANLGVIAGIVFLAIEVRQNQDSLEESNRISVVSTRYNALQSFNQLRYSILQQEGLAETLAGEAPTEMTGANLRRLDSYCGITIWNLATAYETFQALGDEVAAEGAVETTRSAISGDNLMTVCWQRYRARLDLWGYDEFVAAVEEVGRSE